MAIPTLDEIFDEFLDLDPVDQNQYLMELGYDLPPFPDEARTEANRVHGCQSQVWLIMKSSGAESDAKFTIVADSDANIIKGLLAILQAAYNGMTAKQIAEFDILSVFKKIDLEHHITPQRRNGLRGMVERILTLANRHRLVSEGGSVGTELPSTAATGCGLSGPSKPDANARRADALPLAETPAKPFDVAAVRAQFPVLNRSLPSGRQAVFLDSGASAQKPSVVIEKEREVEEQYFANAHRGTYQFGLRIDEEFEGARDAVARFLKAPSSNQIVFTPGTTIGLNIIASGWGRKFVQPGDEILTTVMEHHANFVPWQQLAKERGATLKLIPLTDDGQLDLSRLDEVLTRQTKVVAVTGISNMLGTINPIRQLAKRAHDVGACIVVDGAQSVPHHATDVVADDLDFLVFSGHKVYGPTGVGILYGKPERLDEMDPIIFGGHMIHQVHVLESTWSAVPAKFEAGTMPIVQAIALGSAIRWVEEIGIDAIHQHEQSLLKLAWDKLSTIPGMKIFGPSLEHRGGILSFRIDGLHPEDLAAILDQRDVFTRHGHHCTMPLHTYLGVSATTRVSFGAYNTTEDVERLVDAIEYARSIVR
jgi:cysteine desulfurase/selenocysteine lyase